MKFNNTDLKKKIVKKYLGKYVNIPDRKQKRCFIGYNYDKDIVVIETPGGNHFVEELAENKDLNICKTHFYLAKMYSFREIINLNQL